MRWLSGWVEGRVRWTCARCAAEWTVGQNRARAMLNLVRNKYFYPTFSILSSLERDGETQKGSSPTQTRKKNSPRSSNTNLSTDQSSYRGAPEVEYMALDEVSTEIVFQHRTPKGQNNRRLTQVPQTPSGRDLLGLFSHFISNQRHFSRIINSVTTIRIPIPLPTD